MKTKYASITVAFKQFIYIQTKCNYGIFAKEVNQTKAVCSHYAGSPFVPAPKAIQYSVNTISDM